MPDSFAHSPVLDWYSISSRALPWRQRDANAWQVLVSEVMLQQTPVVRVLPVYVAWVARWPTPAALASDSVAAALRAWGRLGYPRRALRLHEAATLLEAEFDGTVPMTYEELRRLPGVGDYTAAAVLAFAYRQRTLVLDTNVRRVLARAFAGDQFPAPGVTRAERLLAESVLPDDAELAARWSVAVMELGALVCTARSPSCDRCPLSDACRWRARGCPMYAGRPRRSQGYDGTDRQCRGAILALLRESDGPVAEADVGQTWPDVRQRSRALASLVDDGLVRCRNDGAIELPD